MIPRRARRLTEAILNPIPVDRGYPTEVLANEEINYVRGTPASQAKPSLTHLGFHSLAHLPSLAHFTTKFHSRAHLPEQGGRGEQGEGGQGGTGGNRGEGGRIGNKRGRGQRGDRREGGRGGVASGTGEQGEGRGEMGRVGLGTRT